MSARRRRFVARDKKRTVVRLLILLAALILLAGLVFGVVKLIKNGGKKTAKTQLLPFTPEVAHTYTGSGFLYYENSKLYYKDDNDKKNDYSLSASSASAELKLSAASGQAALYNDSSVLIAGTDTPLSFTGTVKRVLCGKNHIAVYVESDVGDSLNIFTATGEPRDVLDFSTTSLIDFGVDAASSVDTLWTLTLSLVGGEPISTVTTYNLAEGTTNGLMNVHSELVEGACFTEKSIFLSGTNHIIRYERSGNTEAYRLLIYGWQVVDHSSSSTGPVFLLHSRAEDGFDNLRIYSVQEGEAPAEKISNVQLPANTLCAKLFGTQLAVFTAEKLYLYGADGKLANELEWETPIVSAEKLSASKALISTGSELYAVNIKG